MITGRMGLEFINRVCHSLVGPLGIKPGQTVAVCTSNNVDLYMIITAINDQAISSQVVLAKTLHARKKGDKVTLEVLVPRQRGPMLVYYRERTEIQVR